MAPVGDHAGVTVGGLIGSAMLAGLSNDTHDNVPAVLVDYFSGCGGTSEGFRQAGIEPIAAVEIDKDAAATYRLNFPEARVFEQDIRDVAEGDLADLIESHRGAGSRIIFSACAPCQPFSRQRRGDGSTDDRVDLLDELLRFVTGLRPDVLFLENVPGLEARAASYGPFSHLVAGLQADGYQVTYGTIHSRRYGVPQLRRRLVVLASLLGPIDFPPETHGPGLCPFVTVRDAIAELPALAVGEGAASINGHQTARLSERNLRRIAATPEGGGRGDWPVELTLSCHRGLSANSYTDAYGRMRWDQQAPAVTTRCISLSNGRFGHPDQDRAISAREAAALQTFPTEFTFAGTLTSMARQIGNAVPVRLAAAFANHLNAHLRDVEPAMNTAS